MRIATIHRYPVKGMSPERLERVALSPGQGLPHDRAFALAHGSTRFDPAAPAWMDKDNFLMLKRNERLAALETAYDPASGILTVKREGKPVARGHLGQSIGRATLEQFFAAWLKGDIRGAPRLVQAEGHVFMDIPEPTITLINAASLADLERVVGRRLDPLRFRANLLIDGAEPWAEFAWTGRRLRLGTGVAVEVLDRIERCAAINVEPGTGKRDLQIPKALQSGFGHVDFGIYLRVIAGGDVAEGDAVEVLPL